MTTITTNVKLIETDSMFLEAVSHKVCVGEEEFYHMPFWYKKVSEGVYVELSFDKLPQSVKNIMQKERDANTYKPASSM